MDNIAVADTTDSNVLHIISIYLNTKELGRINEVESVAKNTNIY